MLPNRWIAVWFLLKAKTGLKKPCQTRPKPKSQPSIILKINSKEPRSSWIVRNKEEGILLAKWLFKISIPGTFSPSQITNIKNRNPISENLDINLQIFHLGLFKIIKSSRFWIENPLSLSLAMVRPVKRELGNGCSGRRVAEPSDAHGDRDRRILRSRYLAVKSKISGNFFFSPCVVWFFVRSCFV